MKRSRTPRLVVHMIAQRHTAWGTTSLVTREALRSFLLNNGFQMAATLAYYAALALMPLLLLVVLVLGSFLHSSEALRSGMQNAMGNLFPSFSGTILDDIIRLSRGKAWGLLSLVLLFWSLVPFAAAFRSAIARSLRSAQKLHFVRAKLLDAMAALSVLILFLFLVISRVLSASDVPAFQILAVPGALRHAVVFLLTACVLAGFYRILAAEKLRFTHLFAGALVAAALLALFRLAFGLMLQFNPNYGYAFGSLKVIFLLIVWVYYTFAVILLGAEISAAIRRRNSLLLAQLFSDQKDTRRATQRLLSKFLRRCDAGEVLFNEGDPGDSMYYVQSGAVEIRKKDNVLKTVEPGEYFGEMAMLLDTPRTAAAVVSLPDTELIEITDDNFEIILRENPQLVRRFLKEMANRLKATSEQVLKHDAPAGETTPRTG